MKAAMLLGLLVAGAFAADRPHHREALVQSKVTPVQKVIQMLTDMQAKGKKEKEDEQVRMATFTQFCKSTTEEKTETITKTTEEISDLTADIAKYGETIMVLEKEIAQHDADISAWEGEKEEATATRAKEHDDFVVEHTDYTASIDSVERAVETIKSGSGTVGLVQERSTLSHLVSLSKVPETAKKVIASFLQGSHHNLQSDLLELTSGAPEAHTYEGHSSGIVDMVEGMGEKMEDKREEIEKEEMNKKHAFDMMAQDLTDSIESNTAQREKKASNKAQAGENKAQAEGDLAEAEKAKAEDEKFLSDLTAECEQKAADFEKRQEVRQGEIEAIGKAIEIMSSSEIGSGTDHLPGLVQTGTSLVQLRNSDGLNRAQKSVADFLRSRASKTQSRLLSLVAVRVQDDPFKKVTKMIKDMIQKLMQEATEEAEHKGFCDTELTTNKQTRDSKTEESDELTAESEKLSADISKLAEEIAGLGEDIAALDALMAKATANREAEKAKNVATIEDAKGAQAATAQAMAVLKEFYDKAAVTGAAVQVKVEPEGAINYDPRSIQILGGSSLLQTGQKPEMEEGGYTGMGNGGVMGMLEVIESDFARLLAETTAGEQEAAAEYEKLSNDSAEDKAVKSTDMKSKTATKTRKESALASTKKDLATTKEELAAAMDYYEKLKPSCVDAGVSYEERVARRKEEIESLQEALKILSAE